MRTTLLPRTTSKQHKKKQYCRIKLNIIIIVVVFTPKEWEQSVRRKTGERNRWEKLMQMFFYVIWVWNGKCSAFVPLNARSLILFRISHIHSLTSKVYVIKCEMMEKETKEKRRKSYKSFTSNIRHDDCLQKNIAKWAEWNAKSSEKGCGLGSTMFGKCNGAQRKRSLRNYYNKSFDFSSF